MNKATLRLNLSGVINRQAPQKVEEYELKGNLSFGFFGGSGDPNKYYPEATAANIMPKEEDFIRVPFRLLSATVVGGGSWKATNFGNEAVLKASMNKLVGLPIFTSHDQEMDNWVGIVESVKWTEQSFQDGQKIPAGIDAILAIDAKTNPKIARGVLLGAIFSNSVTVAFNWKPSHDFGTMEAFEHKVGTYAEDGRMVTRDVTEIEAYYETSLVWLGADPFAKKIVDGKLVNVDTANVVPFEKESATYKTDHKYSIETAFSKELISFSKSQNQPKNEMNKFLEGLLLALGVSEAQLRASLGLDATAEITGDLLKGKLTYGQVTAITAEQQLKVTLFDKMTGTESGKAVFGESPKLEEVSFDNVVLVKKDAHATLTAAVGELATTKTELDAQKAKVTELTPMAELGKEYLSKKQAEAIRLYKLNAGANADESVVELFKNAKTEALDALIKQHLKNATEEFGGHCKSCGSKEFSFQSSFTGAQGSNEANIEKVAKEVSIGAIRTQLEKELSGR